MSTHALLLARMSDPERLVPAAEVLDRSEIVECWHAVTGHVDLVARLNAPPTELLNNIRSLGGVENLEVLDLSGESGNLPCDPRSCYSFIFLEVAADRSIAIQTILADLKQVVFCSSREGAAELIAVVSGDTFQSIDRVIDERIRIIDGVLRLKQDRIINLKQL